MSVRLNTTDLFQLADGRIVGRLTHNRRLGIFWHKGIGSWHQGGKASSGKTPNIVAVVKMVDREPGEAPKVKFRKMFPDAQLPAYTTPGAAGADVRAYLGEGEDAVIEPFGRAIIGTGLEIEVPEGYEVQVRPRSGLAASKGVTVINTPGTIDSDYRGELCIILVNLDGVFFTVNHGDRIAQIVVAPVTQAEFDTVEELSATARGAGGFGSTGVK